MQIALKIDVDTFRGTKDGVPALCNLLKKKGIQATFFFSVGPDNMGRNLWRLFRPQFLFKMLKTKATSLYGWDIIFKGTFWGGPLIGTKLGHIIRQAYEEGHEIGLHAWDHYAWQAKMQHAGEPFIRNQIQMGMEMLEKITGQLPKCSAAPAWKCTDKILRVKESYDFSYNSDCRGQNMFYPFINGESGKQPQIPTTLPTYDEVIGRNGITNGNYNQHLISLVKRQDLNVLTIHAEAEGIACFRLFEDFIEKIHAEGGQFIPLGTLLNSPSSIPSLPIKQARIPGREGFAAVQEG
ncbi:MAG: 4-deoxy-4-formamido-L-arabinose-phosphoundecaprenol deformylase [Candidatus Aureabacteria bacterium]|nr:4-deoxy-4-formamido-L-arabinose-phosphoundecaprenol deformylase [Candidatus Auribacterota bacterium]